MFCRSRDVRPKAGCGDSMRHYDDSRPSDDQEDYDRDNNSTGDSDGCDGDDYVPC